MKRSLRVLQLINSLAPSGAERSLAALAPHLVKEGIDVHVGYLIERGGMRTALERSEIPVHSLADGPAIRRAWTARTTALVAELRPAIVHTTLFEADLAGRQAAARLGVPCVSSLVNTAYGRTEANREGVGQIRLRAAHAADAWTARRVTRFHALTQHVATVMGRRLLIPARKIDVIPRGRDSDQLGRRSAERRAAVRDRLGIPQDVPVILAIGRQEPQKGFDVLLKSLTTVRSQRPDTRVLIAGREGRASTLLNELVRLHSLTDMVTFLGRRDDVPDLLSAADVFALPSLWEGFAGTVLEAMALECPIVASRLPTLLETIDESTAALVASGDPDQLARTVVAVLADSSSAGTRARAARRRFEQDFTIEVSARRIADLYYRVAVAA
jgi:glycosyltransferase involved in cell wall biosynthesis